jgi:H+/Cl- antiporter ClcA
MTKPGELNSGMRLLQKGDFTAGARLLWISALALVIGALCAGVAYVLLGLIDFFTSYFYFQRLSFDPLHPASPAGNALGLAAVAVPVVGGLIIGFMARYGSDRIRGHGIPEPSKPSSSAAAACRPRSPSSSRCRPPSPSVPAGRSAPKAPSS